jgi:GNAT superfamily N-acetyltransferase
VGPTPGEKTAGTGGTCEPPPDLGRRNIALITPPRPLAEDDDRSAFDRGRDSLNAWFRRHAWHNQASGVWRVSVVLDAASGRIAGYVTLRAAQIEREFMPKSWQRNRPDPVPTTLLGQLAIETAVQGQGHSAALLMFALRTALRASESVGSMGVLTHPLDDRVRSFYARWGFQDLPFDPRRAMFVRTGDLHMSFAN